MAAKANLAEDEVDPFLGFRNYMQVLRSYVEGMKKVAAKHDRRKTRRHR